MNNIMNYKTVIAIFQNLLDKGGITKDEFAKIKTLMGDKYGLPKCSIYR